MDISVMVTIVMVITTPPPQSVRYHRHRCQHHSSHHHMTMVHRLTIINHQHITMILTIDYQQEVCQAIVRLLMELVFIAHLQLHHHHPSKCFLIMTSPNYGALLYSNGPID
jgi:hypothetical protein